MARLSLFAIYVAELNCVASRNAQPCGPASLYFASAHPPPPPFEGPQCRIRADWVKCACLCRSSAVEEGLERGGWAGGGAGGRWGCQREPGLALHGVAGRPRGSCHRARGISPSRLRSRPRPILVRECARSAGTSNAPRRGGARRASSDSGGLHQVACAHHVARSVGRDTSPAQRMTPKSVFFNKMRPCY